MEQSDWTRPKHLGHIELNRTSIGTQSVPSWRFGIISNDKVEHRAYDPTDGHLPRESSQKVCWVVCERITVGIAVDQLRPGTDADSLISSYLDTKEPTHPGHQQSYIDKTIVELQAQDGMQGQMMDTERQGSKRQVVVIAGHTTAA